MRFGKKPGDRPEGDGDAAGRAERLAAEKAAEAERLAAEAKKLAEQAAAERAAAEKAAAEKVATEKAATEKAAAETAAPGEADGAQEAGATDTAPAPGDAAPAPGGTVPGDTAPAPGADGDPAPGEKAGRRGPRRLILAASAGAVVFTAVAAVAGWQWAEHEGPSPSEENSAFLVDAQTETAQVAQAARDIVAGVFSYDYTDLDTYQKALERYLDPAMLARYQETADQNVQIITQAQTSITASVAEGDAGVEKLAGDKAVAVVIMARQGTNAGSQEVSDSAPLRITMVRSGDAWKADDITLL